MNKRWIMFLLTGLIMVSLGTALAQGPWDTSKTVYQKGDVNVTEAEEAAGNPIFLIEMEDGKIMRGELYPQVAPQAVGNFIALANSGFYDGLTFHRVIPGFMIQGGCPLGTGTGNPGWAIQGEFAANGIRNDLLHTVGVLSMARSSQPNSAGSQFFIMTETSPHLDGQYAAFGKVLEGMDAADEIVNVQRDTNDKPKQPQVMKTVRVETFDKDYPYEKR